LLSSKFLKSKNRRPLLGNVSVNTFPRKRLAYGNGVVSAVRAEELRKRVGLVKPVLYGRL
jgi:hypothetical protein